MTEFLTVNAACARLGVSRSTLYRLMRRGEIDYVWVGHRRRVPDLSLLVYLARNGAADAAEGEHDG
jgi:excisionase family DNA binding protein